MLNDSNYCVFPLHLEFIYELNKGEYMFETISNIV